MIDGLNEEALAASHQRVVLSPYWVVGGPDFEAMQRVVRVYAYTYMNMR